MDSKRFLLALALSVAVIFGVQRLFPRMNASDKQGEADYPTAGSKPVTSAQTSPSAATVSAVPRRDSILATSFAKAETTTVMSRSDNSAQFVMSNVGAVPVSIVMKAYDNRSSAGGKVDLAAQGQPVVRYQAVINQSAPIDLSGIPFSTVHSGDTLTYQASVANTAVAIRYAFSPDSYVVHVNGTIASEGDKNYIIVDLPKTLVATESDTADDRNSLAYAYFSKHDGARSLLFRSLDPGEKTLVTGPLTWVAAKSKYFVVGMLAPKGAPEFSEVTFVGGTRTSKIATTASATVVVPIIHGAFAFDLYTGPQSLRQLEAQGRNFDEVNPYGWAFLRGVMQPIAIGVTKLVLWMHERLALSYGLVLVLLGVLVRLILWPLNQNAMRSSLKVQEIQPKLQAVQTRYKDDPEKQRVEVMKVYTENGMSPLSPFMGCLPMLLPMPVLFALFFVFRNTIEFRGVHFLWLTDLSSRDPFYILPILMGISMYVLSWIGMRNSPPNPQAKMMSYMMPPMFVVFLLRAASGLNLYYAVQNLAALPQQWMLAKERIQRAAKS
jgi:YidC/Oxa1 family membrane protein insertase